MKFKVRLVRVTRDYVEVLVDEDDVDTADHATDYVNDRMGDPDWDPQDHAIPDSEYADVHGTWDVLDVEPVGDGGPGTDDGPEGDDELPGAKTGAMLRACRAAGIEVTELRLGGSELRPGDLTGLPVLTRAEACILPPPMSDRLVLPRGTTAEAFYARMRELE